MFKLFSSEARIRIIEGLKEQREMCVAEIRRHLGVMATQAATSQHLRILRDAGAVKCRKDGLLVLYSIDELNMAFMQQEVNKLYKPLHNEDTKA